MLAATSNSCGSIHTSSVISIDRGTTFSLPSYGISRVATGFSLGPLRSARPNITGGSGASATPAVSALIIRYVAAGGCFVALRVPLTSFWSATLVETGRSISLQHHEMFGFANGFIPPALKHGHVTITFPNESSSFDFSPTAISLLVCIGLFNGLFVCELLQRRDNEHGTLDQRKGVMS